MTRESELATVPHPDAEIVVASLSQPERFAEIFERHFETIHGYLARRVGENLADDLASQVFVVAFERRATVRAESASVRPWLYGIATNLLRNDARSERRRLAALARLQQRTDSGADDLDSVDEAANCRRLARVVAELEPDLRDVLLLHAWEELSYAEIGLALGIPTGTVASRLARSRLRLHAVLDGREREQRDKGGVSPRRKEKS